MKKIAAFTIAAGVLAGTAFGKVSFSLDIEALLSGDGASTISDSGLLVLVVDKSGTGNFAMPTAGSIASGETDVVATWDLGDYDFENPGIQLVTPDQGVTYEEDWNVGDPLALFWFPTLSKDNMVPAADTAFGVFADAFNLASGHSWMMPADGALAHSLKFFTAAAEHLVDFGDFPEGAGVTAFAVNNLPAASGIPDISVVNGGGKSTISWTIASSPVGGYIIQRKTNGGEWETIGFAESGAVSFDDTDVNAGAEYQYQVYSVSGSMVAQSDLPPAVESERSVFFNVAARSRIVEGNAQTQMFGGVIVEGNDPTKNIIMQAIGRSYLGTDNFASDPSVEAYRIVPGVPAELIDSNDSWLAADDVIEIESAMADGNAVELSADPTHTDATVLIDATINHGHTFAVASDDTGDALLTIFDADSDTLGINDNRIVSLSVRGFIDESPDSLFVAGVNIRGNVPKQVLVMGWGPYLGEVADTNLADLSVENPRLRLRVGEEVIASNDDWGTQMQSSSSAATLETDSNAVVSVIESLGFDPFETGSADAAMLVTLDPGVYTFEVDGLGGEGLSMIVVEEVE